jgi:glycogen operon protein
MRQFWKGEGTSVSELATRLSGSNDLYATSGRQPYASINFITAHDGFTLNDLVSYNEKHNEKNREENRDGENNNISWNCGVEGRPTTRRWSRCASARSATSWRRCCSRRVCR